MHTMSIVNWIVTKEDMRKFCDETNNKLEITWYCSNCKRLPKEFNDIMDTNPKYCPQCGSKILWE